MSGSQAPVEPGNVLRLRDVPVGQPVFNLELQPGKGGKLVRAAHTCAVITVKQDSNAIVKLPSGKQMNKLSPSCKSGRFIKGVPKLSVI